MPLTREQFMALREKGLTAEQIAAFEAGKTPPSLQELSPWESTRARIATGLHYLPEVGGAVGGMIGAVGGGAAGLPAGAPAGPPGMAVTGTLGAIRGRAGGAFLGGAAGKAAELAALRGLGYEQPGGLPGAATEVGKAGAVQAGLETAGGLIAKPFQPAMRAVGGRMVRGATPAAKGLYDFALGLTKTIRRQFGDLAEPMLARRIPVGKGATAAAEQAAKAVQAEVGTGLSRVEAMAEKAWASSVDDVDRILKAADESGAEVHVEEIAEPIIDRIAKNAGKAGKELTDKDRTKILKMVAKQTNRLVREGTYNLKIIPPSVSFTPSSAHVAKQAAQQQSKAWYRAREAGMAVGARPQRLAGVGAGLREAIEEKAPGYQAAEEKVRHMIGVREALKAKPGSAKWDKIISSGDPLLESIATDAKALQQLQRAVEVGRRTPPMGPVVFPEQAGSPQVAELISRSRETIGTERALRDVMARKRPLAALLMPELHGNLGRAVGVAIPMRTVVPPQVASRLAILLNDPTVSRIVSEAARQSPRAAETILSQLMYRPPSFGEEGAKP